MKENNKGYLIVQLLSFIQEIKIIFAKREVSSIFWFTTIFYFLLLFNLNNKTLALFFILFLIILTLLLKDFKKSLFLSYLASWPIDVGKQYYFELVSPWQLNLPYHPGGIGPSVIISVREIFLFIMFLVLVRDFFLGKKHVFRLDRISIILVFYFFSLLVSAIIGSIRPEISVVVSLFSISPLILYWYIRNIANKRETLLKGSIAVFSSIIILEALLANIQFLRRGLIGISLESTWNLPFDFSSEVGAFVYRPIGSFAHANVLGEFLLFFLFALIPVIYLKLNKIRSILVFSLLAGVWTLILTLSRSSWSSFIVCVILFIFIVEKRWGLRVVVDRKTIKTFSICLILIIPFIVLAVLPRISNTFLSFNSYGTGYVRFELIKEAVDTIVKYPLFGIGLGMGSFYSYQMSLINSQSVFSSFPEVVHNGILSHLVETGIFSTAFYLLVPLLIVRRLIKYISLEKNIYNKVLTLALFCGLLSLYLNSLWQPFGPDLQKVVFLSIIYANYE